MPFALGRLRLLSGGFLLCLVLSFVIFAKHPYQIKYLLPQTYLFFAYCLLCFRHFDAALPSPRALRIFALVMALVALNGFVNFHVVHRYNLIRYTQVKEVVDRILKEVPAAHYYFSLEVPHDWTAYGFGVREIPDLLPIFEQEFAPLTVFRERNSDYSISQAVRLPLEAIPANSLILTKRYFDDARAELIFHDEDLELFAYKSPRL